MIHASMLPIREWGPSRVYLAEGVCKAEGHEPHLVGHREAGEFVGQRLQDCPREREHCSALGTITKRHCFNKREAFLPVDCHDAAELPT